MMNYEHGPAAYTKSRVKRVTTHNQHMTTQIRALNGVFTNDSVAQDLTIYIIDAVERCQREIDAPEASTLALISNLRFVFETCITARLLNLESSYKFKIRFSIYKHQLDKSRSLGLQANAEIQRLNKLKQAEDQIDEKYNLREHSITNRQKIDTLYEDLNNEISIFLDSAESMGADFLCHKIKQYIQSHEAREAEIKKEWELIKKEILQDPEALSFFDFKGQISKVDKELTDKRTWKEKAIAVGLGEIHDFLYDYTSSIMHSTSYSLMIPNELEAGERFMIEGLSARFTYSILIELCKFARIPTNATIIDTNHNTN
ncbi:hypothetical protein HX866_26910 [Pseudomonas gingeri]|uniref:hypothetical protein n=1 Tax=Pseudomonas gingeri TaxID=117681 RepID=UPI0015A012D8|nr:hypothetical protein [Pseudomonas gingeri]NWA28528.1 hypothetical protein [Pseudomonas gingeri]